MSSTEQIRKWYHQGVVLNHADRGKPGYEPRCNHNHPTVAFPRSGGVFNEPVNPLCKEAFEAYASVMRDMGVNMPGAGGVNSCRNIANTNTPSLHAYLCAVDLPPNSFKPTSFIVAIEDIRTNSGAQVFRNLSGDRMHDQINCSPTALATGVDWSTVTNDGRPPPGDDDMETIKAIQKQCNAGGFKGANGRALTVDGLLGPNTQHAMDSLAVAAAQNPVPGPRGEQGTVGATGAKGDRGRRGTAGADGPTGPPGPSSTLTISGDVTLP